MQDMATRRGKGGIERKDEDEGIQAGRGKCEKEVNERNVKIGVW